MIAALKTTEPTLHRVWAMPNANTFSIVPIRDLVSKYLCESQCSIDPFARNSRLATYTNDLNPETGADCHFTADKFLMALKEANVRADLIFFDPPYSLRQVKECYAGVGRKFLQSDSQSTWSIEKNLCAELLEYNGIFIHFGWHSNALGLKRGFEIIELLLVAHGGAHNDTICTVERKVVNS